MPHLSDIKASQESIEAPARELPHPVRHAVLGDGAHARISRRNTMSWCRSRGLQGHPFRPFQHGPRRDRRRLCMGSGRTPGSGRTRFRIDSFDERPMTSSAGEGLLFGSPTASVSFRCRSSSQARLGSVADQMEASDFVKRGRRRLHAPITPATQEFVDRNSALQGRLPTDLGAIANCWRRKIDRRFAQCRACSGAGAPLPLGGRGRGSGLGR